MGYIFNMKGFTQGLLRDTDAVHRERCLEGLGVTGLSQGRVPAWFCRAGPLSSASVESLALIQERQAIPGTNGLN